jgi:site-specific DNA-methyltransferase (adenine-specific)
LYRCNALALLQALPTAGVDGLVTDAPYSSGGSFRGDRTGSVSAKYLSTDSKQAEYLPQFAGDNRDQRAFGYWCSLWLGEALRVVRPGRAAVLFTDWRQLATTTDVFQSGGWVMRGICPWVKPWGAVRPQMGRFAQSAEFMVWGTAGPALDDETLGCPPGVVNAAAPRGDDREHVTQKPVEAMLWALSLVPREGVVLDLFAGSGSTGVAQLQRGGSFIGAEWTEANAEVAARRLEQAESDGVPVPLFGPRP